MEEQHKLERFPGRNRFPGRPQAPQDFASGVVEADEAIDLLAYWRVIRKRHWTIATIFFVLFTLVLIGTLRQTPIYRATGLLEIQKENPDIMTVQELFELEGVSDTYLETQYKILQSGSLARRVIDQLGLIKLEEFNPPKGWLSFGKQEKRSSDLQVFAVGDAGFEQDREAYQIVLERFYDRLGVAPVKGSRLVEVSFESEDPELAARVVNTLASNHIEQNLEARYQATQVATEWLSKELVGLKISLEKSEDDLQAYARRKGLLFLETEQGNPENIVNQRLRQLQEELTKGQAERYQKESLYRLVEAGDYGALPGVFDSNLMQELTVALAQVKREQAEMETTFTSDYPGVKKIQNQVDELESVLAQERDRAARRITNDYQAAVERERLLRQAFEAQQVQANLIAERSVQYNILKREVDTNKQLYVGLLERMKEAAVSAGLNASNIRIVDPAEPPDIPARPRVLLNLVLAVILGLGLGVGVAFFQDHLDNTLKTSEDVERFLRVPALALIPSAQSLNGHRGGVYGFYERGKLLASGHRGTEEAALAESRSPKKWHRIDADWEQHSALVEAFRGLRTSVLLSTAERPPRSLLVTSAQPGEGKTTVSTNLAISLAQLGQRVLLVDGDLRRPSVHKNFPITDSSGLVGYLTGQKEWRSLVRTTGTSCLDVLICGPIPPNPAELLSSDRMRTLLHEAVGDYAFVVLDSPPVLNVADSRILATLVEGLVLVVKGGVTPREIAQRAQSYAHDVGAHVIGVVLNNLDVHAHDYYYSQYYRYDYSSSGEEASDKA